MSVVAIVPTASSFYSCDCGSRVFFETLGPPWRTHSCYPGEDLYAPRRPSTSFVPRRSDWCVCRARRGRSSHATWFAGQLLLPSTTPFAGSTRSGPGERRSWARCGRCWKSPTCTRCSATRTLPWAGRFWGKLASGPMGKVTVHAPPETRGDHIREIYTAWVPVQRVRGSEVVRGAAVEAELEAVVVPDRPRCVVLLSARGPVSRALRQRRATGTAARRRVALGPVQAESGRPAERSPQHLRLRQRRTGHGQGRRPLRGNRRRRDLRRDAHRRRPAQDACADARRREHPAASGNASGRNDDRRLSRGRGSG